MRNLLILCGLSLIIFSCGDDEGDLNVDCSISDLSVSIASQTASICGNPNASVTLDVSGGTGDFSFRVNNGEVVRTNTIGRLSPGINEILVKDAAGCEAVISVEIFEKEEVSFVESIRPILDTNCAITGCHVAGTSRQNFTLFERVQQLSTEIKRRTQSLEMPPGNRTISQSDIALIACWVDQGARDN